MTAALTLARVVADAVLYEGYLLYPYRASSRKNQARWQFGVLGPPGAAEAGVGEQPGMFADCLLVDRTTARVEVRLRFLQLQSRVAERAAADGFTRVEELSAGGETWRTWDEATEHEIELGTWSLDELAAGLTVPVEIAGGEAVEKLRDDGRVSGRLVRTRERLQAVVRLSVVAESGYLRLRTELENVTTSDAAISKDAAIACSFIGTHLLLVAHETDFVSLLDPPAAAQAAAAACGRDRLWPVLTGSPEQSDVLLMSPIILYDHPSVAEESAGDLFDSTEIDEILTLRIMTMTDAEKAEARATDRRAAEIIDRCDAMSAEELQRLHGVLRDPHALDRAGGERVRDDVPQLRTPDLPPAGPEVPWWDPEADASVSPDTDSVPIQGVPVARGTEVTVRPSRRADAQDLFFAGRRARVTSVHFDVDGSTHIGVVLEDDPAAELHDWYGRSLYFAPEEIEPVAAQDRADRKERQP